MKKLYEGLTYKNPELRRDFITAKMGSVDDFAETFAPLIVEYFKKNTGQVLDYDSAYQEASNLWGYLREQKKPIPLNISGVAYVTKDDLIKYCTSGVDIPKPLDFVEWDDPFNRANNKRLNSPEWLSERHASFESPKGHRNEEEYVKKTE